MGCSHSRSDLQHITFSVPVDSVDVPVGESKVFRAPYIKELTHTIPNEPEVTTVHDVYVRAFKKFPNNIYLGTREKEPEGKFGPYRWKTYGQVQEVATRLGSGCLNLNLVSPVRDYQDIDVSFLIIWSKNREEWLTADIACVLYNFALVPVYDTLGPETINYVFSQTRATTLIVSNDHIEAAIGSAGKCETLRNIIALEAVTAEQTEKAKSAGLRLLTWEDVLRSGVQKQEYRRPKPEDLYTVNYTSGTTGLPKGAMITHRAQLACSSAVCYRADIELTDKDSYISYLPLAHTLERTATLFMAIAGMSIGFFSGDVMKLKDDLQELKPTLFISVPRLFNRFYEKMQEGLGHLKGLKKSLANKAVETKLKNLEDLGSLQHGIYDSLVFSKMKAALGGRVRLMLSGSAPIEPEVQNFFRIAIGVPFVEGYGQTETCAASFISNTQAPSFGHVGGPQSCMELKVVDVPEMKYTSTDRNEDGLHTPRGEVCLRGPSAFGGYYKDPERTAETLDKDGWVHTGDIGRINPDGSLSIIDRKKNIFKLAQGEYVAAEKVEGVYVTTKYVAEAFLYGDSLKSYTVAIVVPNKEMLTELGQEMKLGNLSYEELCQNKDIKAKVLGDLNKKGKEHKIASFELAKQIHIEPVSFGDRNLLTPTFKVIRHEAKAYYQKIIDDLYKLPLDAGKS